MSDMRRHVQAGGTSARDISHVPSDRERYSRDWPCAISDSQTIDMQCHTIQLAWAACRLRGFGRTCNPCCSSCGLIELPINAKGSEYMPFTLLKITHGIRLLHVMTWAFNCSHSSRSMFVIRVTGRQVDSVVSRASRLLLNDLAGCTLH
jgi:hypothetical protein